MPATEPTSVWVGLGSNLGDPRAQVRTAVRALASEVPASRLCTVSSLYSSPPMGPPDQPDYVNAVAGLETSLEPLAFLAALQDIERRHGRRRDGVRWGPRTLDLDLLLWGETELDLPQLKVPHPGLTSRAFVLYPLAELAPDIRVPRHGAVATLRDRVDGSGLRRLDAE
jgi:2-amino-4-hydroxy-6-hydroxymethyldihydropteridine diphosphokinase